MGAPSIICRLRARRVAAGLSQQALAIRVGVSRQALIAIEAGRQSPSTTLSLQLARALGCAVEDLFELAMGPRLVAAVAAGTSPESRVTLGHVEGRWVAHPVPPESPAAADGVVLGASPEGLAVEPLAPLADLEQTALVAGCAPLIGVLTSRLGQGARDARATWVPANSQRALELLEAGLVHVAGLHLASDEAQGHEAIVRRRFPGRRMLIATLTVWRQGLVLAPGNPLAVREVTDILRPDVRFVRREEGAGARQIVQSSLRARGHRLSELGPGPEASDHAAVASLVRWGAADAGVAIEGAALAQGLDFVPLSEERFDLVVPAERAEDGPVARLLDLLGQASFRTEAARLPGYDLSATGEVTTVEGGP